jgi:hypothetical protein
MYGLQEGAGLRFGRIDLGNDKLNGKNFFRILIPTFLVSERNKYVRELIIPNWYKGYFNESVSNLKSLRY